MFVVGGALALAGVAAARPDAGLAALVLWTGALLVGAGSAPRGPHAAGAPVAVAWLALQPLAVGLWPDAGAAAGIAGLCVLISVSAGWFVPRTRTNRSTSRRGGAAAVLLAVVAAVLTAPLFASHEMPEASQGHGLAWAALYLLWRQRLASFAVAAAVGVVAWWVSTTESLPALHLAAALCAPILVAAPADLGVRRGPALAAGAGAVTLASLAAGSPGVAVLGLLAVLLDRLSERRTPQVDGPGMDATARAVRTLAPYPRWYGLTKLRVDPLYRWIDREVRTPGRVLDVGCGMALAGGVVAAHAQRYVGIDLDADKVLAGRALLARVSTPDAQLLHAPFPTPALDGARFDTAFLFDVLHYADAGTQRALLEQLTKHVEPAGRLYVRDAVRDAEGPGRVERSEAWTTRFGFNPPGPVHVHDDAGWRALFADAGWQVADSAPCGDENVIYTLERGSTQS